MTTNDPKSVVLAYQDAFYKNDRAAVRKTLADKGSFLGPLNSYTDPDLFLDGAAIFMQLTQETKIKAVVAEGNDVCVVYESKMKVPSMPVIPIASWFRVESGKIVHFHVHFDPAPFIKAKENGDIAKTLQAKA